MYEQGEGYLYLLYI